MTFRKDAFLVIMAGYIFFSMASGITFVVRLFAS